MIVLDPKTLEISTTKNQAPKIGVYGLEERLRGGKTHVCT